MPKPVEPISEISPENLRQTDTGYLYDDEAACKLALQAVSDGEAWMNQQNWPAGWSNNYIVYQSPTSAGCFDGGNGNSSANVPNYLVSNLCDTNVPKVMGGLFYESPPFLLRPRPGTTQDIITAKTALFAYQLDDMHFEEECELAVLQGALIGTMVMKWGWHEEIVRTKKYVRKAQPEIHTDAAGVKRTIHTAESDEFTVQDDEQLVSRPWIKYCDRRNVLVNRGCKVGDIRKAKDVTYTDFATYEDLDNLRDYEGYNIPPEEDLKTWFLRERETQQGDNISVALPESMRGWIQTSLPRNYRDSADPLQNGMKIIEYWSKNMVIVVLQHLDDNIIIRNEANPYKKIPFLSACWRPIPDCFDGQGIGTLAGPNQIVAQGITNMSLSRLDYGLNPTALRAQGFNTTGQDIVWTQGGIIEVDVAQTGGDVHKAFGFLEFPEQDPAAMAWLQQQMGEAKESSGANALFSMGGSLSGIQSTGARSGTGAAQVGQAAAGRLDGPINRFVRQIFVPWLRIMDELNNERLPSSVLRQVLSQEMQQTMEIDHEKFRNAKMEYEALAGSKLGPKKEMAQFFTFLTQILNNPSLNEMIAESGYTFDIVAIFKLFADSAGWKYSQPFLVKMTPEQQKQRAMNSPAAIQAQKGQQAQQQSVQKFQQTVQEEQEKELAKAGGEVIRTSIEHGMQTDPLAQPFTGAQE
jgi:hypothetical protein